MIRRLALIAVLVFSRSLLAASDHAHPPIQTQTADGKGFNQAADLNTPRQVPIPATDFHTNAKSENAGSNDSSQGPKEQAKEESITADEPQAKKDKSGSLSWRDCLKIFGGLVGIATIVGVVIRCLAYRANRKDAKIAVEAAKQTFLAEQV